MLETSRPTAAIADRIDAYWERNGDGMADRILPDGCMDFVFDLDTGRAIVVGTMTTASIVTVPSGTRLFGVRFLPGVAASYLTDSPLALLDTSAPLADVTAARTLALAERIVGAKSGGERQAVIAEFVKSPRARARPLDARVRRAVELLRASAGRTSVASVARAVGVGERQLERLFKERLGVSPKHYARVARMERALSLRGARAHRQADIAQLAGYADEPHLIRELRALAGTSLAGLGGVSSRDVGFVQVRSPSGP